MELDVAVDCLANHRDQLEHLVRCGNAHGELSSRYSTPNSSSFSAIATFCAGVKWARANCSPSRSVDSMILNALIVMAPPKTKKPSSTGTRGLLSWYHPTSPIPRE